MTLLLITKYSNAQDYNIYQASDAAMLQVNGDMRIESRLKTAVIALSNNSNQLSVRLNIPDPSIDYTPTDSTMLSSTGLLFNLKIYVQPVADAGLPDFYQNLCHTGLSYAEQYNQCRKGQ